MTPRRNKCRGSSARRACGAAVSAPLKPNTAVAAINGAETRSSFLKTLIAAVVVGIDVIALPSHMISPTDLTANGSEARARSSHLGNGQISTDVYLSTACFKESVQTCQP